MAALAVGLGPCFAASLSCELALETSWEDLGRIVRNGPTLPLRGEPRAGVGRERAVYAPLAGPFQTERRIGDRVGAGEAVAAIGGRALSAPLAGAKVLEVDPRGDPTLCRGVGERPRASPRPLAPSCSRRPPQ